MELVFSFLQHPFWPVYLACFAPTLAFASNNISFYQNRQIYGSLALISVVGLILGLGSTWLYHILGSTWIVMQAAELHISLPDALTCGFSLLCFFFFSERFFSEVLPERKRRRLVLWSIALLCLLLSSFLTLLPLTLLFILHIAFSCADIKRNIGQEKEITPLSAFEKSRDDDPCRATISLSLRPNIYLLILESYHSKEALKELYAIDDSSTETFMQNNGFTVYENMYANGIATVNSIHYLLDGMFSQRTDYPFVIDVLRNNGYTFEFFDSFVFTSLARAEDYTSFAMSRRALQLYKLAGPLFSQSSFLLRFIGGSDPLTPVFNFTTTLQLFSRRITLPSRRPRFFGLRFGADHKNSSVWSGDAGPFAKEYANHLIPRARNQLKKIVGLIVEHDPEALVIATGDHGALRFGRAWDGPGEPNDILRKRGVSVRTLALDHFSVFLAIRWAAPHKTENTVFSLINLFRYVFAALGGGEEILEQLQPNISLLQKKFVVVRDGRPLESLEPYTPRENLDATLQRYHAGDISVHDWLLLLNGLPFALRKKFHLYDYAYRNFPHDVEVQAKVGREYCRRGMAKGLDILKKISTASASDVSLALAYAHSLLCFGKFHDAVQLLNQRNVQQCPEALLTLASSYWALNLPEMAIEACKNVIDSVPNRTREQALVRAQGYYVLSLLFNEMEKPEEALPLLEQGIQEHDRHWSRHALHIYRLYAMLLLKCHEFAAAEEVLSRIAMTNIVHGWGMRLLSFARERQGKLESARQTLQNGCNRKSNPKHVEVALGCFLIRNKISGQDCRPLRNKGAGHLNNAGKLFSKYDIFSSTWYLNQLKSKHRAPLRHYVFQGAYLGLNPVPWFNTITYIALNDIIWDDGIHPFLHFAMKGCQLRKSASLRHHPNSLTPEPRFIFDKEDFFYVLNTTWGYSDSKPLSESALSG